jgi:Antirestriction protein
MNANPTSQKIEAREVSNDERLQMLPRHFGRHLLTVENAVYACMRQLSSRYTGGYWRFFELSNGGFYMAPHQTVRDGGYRTSSGDGWKQGSEVFAPVHPLANSACAS